MGTYLLVQKWHPSFSVEQGITHVTAWVRFPRLPVIWYNRHFMTYLGNLLGETVKIDLNTQQGYRGRFARVAVMIDISQPLLDKFELNGQWYNVEYEGLQAICFTCGRIGHLKAACMVSVPTDNVTGDDRMAGEEDKSTETDQPEKSVGDKQAEEDDRYGPWMQAWRPNRYIRKQTEDHDTSVKSGDGRKYGNKEGINGSRFGALAEEGDQIDVSTEKEIPASQSMNDRQNKTAKIKESQAKMKAGRRTGNQRVGNKEVNNFQFRAKNKIVQGPMEASTKGDPKGKSVASDTVGGAQPIKEALVRLDKTNPITVGPLSHGTEAGTSMVTAERGVNSKIRKLQSSKGELSNVLNDMDLAFKPGKPPGFEGEGDPVVQKSMTNRTGFVLGKRKTVSIAQREGSINKATDSVQPAAQEIQAPLLNSNEQEMEGVSASPNVADDSHVKDQDDAIAEEAMSQSE